MNSINRKFEGQF